MDSSIYEITGQDRPENQALLSRCVVLRKEAPSEMGSSGYYALKAEGKKLTLAIRWLLENKNKKSVAEYWQKFYTIMSELKIRIKNKSGDYNERTAVNYAIIASGFGMYDIHEYDNEFLNWLVDECLADMNRKQAEDIIYRFFSDIEVIFSENMRDVVKKTYSGVYLHYSLIYNEWVKNMRSTGMQEYIGKEGLLDYMRKDPHDYWMEPEEQKGMHRKYFQSKQVRCIGIMTERLPKHIKDVVDGWDIAEEVD